MEPTAEGIDPVNLLCVNERYLSLTMAESAGLMEPPRALLPKDKYVSECSPATVCGIDPISWLDERSSTDRKGRLPMALGIEPVKPSPLRTREFSELSSPIDVEMLPCSGSFERTICATVLERQVTPVH